MKTWTEWLGVQEPNDTLSLPINKYQYQQIQLDAMKEGMRRAAEVVGNNHAHSCQCRCDSCIATNGDIEAILYSVEQLTEKDL